MLSYFCISWNCYFFRLGVTFFIYACCDWNCINRVETNGYTRDFLKYTTSCVNILFFLSTHFELRLYSVFQNIWESLGYRYYATWSKIENWARGIVMQFYEATCISALLVKAGLKSNVDTCYNFQVVASGNFDSQT